MRTIIIAKWCLFGLFLWNIGVFSFIAHQSTHPRRVGTEEERRRDLQFLTGIYEQAQKLGDGYTPSLYFKDLMRIELRQNHDSIHYMVDANGFKMNLNSLIMQKHERLMRTNSEEREKFSQEITAAQKEYDEVMDPGKEMRLAKSKQEWRDGTAIKSILTWIWEFYAKNLPIAFALLYLWWIEERKKWRINNPLSFIICLLIYPYTLIRVWVKKLDYETRRWAMEISFRRTDKTIFTMISEDELAVISRFAKESNLKGYKKYLHNRGLVVRHSFLPAALITMVLLIMVPKVYGNTPVSERHDAPKYFLEIKAPPGTGQIPLVDIRDLNPVEAILPIVYFTVEWAKERYLIAKSFKTHRGFAKALDPVPLFD